MPSLRVLVIDDQALERRILEHYLKEADMEVLEASEGASGLALAQTAQPDVILLDVMMAGQDGLAVCEALKSDPRTRDIPVVFITSLSSKEAFVRGLDCGAADFVNKPVDKETLLARVRTHARMHQQHRDHLALSQELERIRRENEIMHLTEGIGHNLNNLLGVIMGYLNLIQQSPDKADKVLKNAAQMEAAVERMTKIIRQLTVIGHFHSAKLQPVRLHLALQGAVNRFGRSAKPAFRVLIESTLKEDFVWVTNREILESSLEQLLLNGQQSYRDRTDTGELRLQAELEETDPAILRISVLDRGRGIPESLRDSIFDPFVSSSAEVGRGMGLTLARHGAHCLHGELVLLPRPAGGTEARLTLPRQSCPDTAP